MGRVWSEEKSTIVYSEWLKRDKEREKGEWIQALRPNASLLYTLLTLQRCRLRRHVKSNATIISTLYEDFALSTSGRKTRNKRNESVMFLVQLTMKQLLLLVDFPVEKN